MQRMTPTESGTLGGAFFGTVNHGGLADTRIMVRFYMGEVTTTTADGIEATELREHIEFPLLGEQTRVRRLATETDRKRYAQAYAAFSQGLDTVAHGTPLEQLPGITQRQVQMAALHGVRAIEDMTDERAALSMGMDGRLLAARCKAWLEARAGAESIDRAAALEKALADMAAMTTRMAELEAAVSAKDAVLRELNTVRSGDAGGESQPRYVERDDWKKDVADAFVDGEDIADDDSLATAGGLDAV